MKRHKLTVAGLIIAVAAVVVYFSMTRSADEDKQAFAYPSPRYPRYLANPSAEELMRGARFAVRQPVGRAPLGRMESGRTVYVFAHAGLDMKVWEAIRQAWAERGVEAHVLHPWEVMGISREEFDRRMTDTPKGNEGWKELGFFRGEYLKYFPEEVRKEFGTDVFSDADYRRKDIPRYLDAHPEVQFYYAGEGGGAGFIQPYDKEISEKHGDKFVGNYIYYRVGDLTSKAAEYPTDVWNLVEEKILRPRTFVSEVTLQDPEGTNLHWTLTPEQSLYWTRGGNVGGGSEAASNHISIYPSPLFSNFQEGGILVAHSNHTGMYPTMKAYLNRYGQIERIEGGGKLGEMFEILLNHPLFKEAKFPKAPEPGYWFFR
ncbi:MAG: hypothetical protein HY649_03360, partial [Acidobacteria bacterium]|nr:hypothetical protein [Acidobacteriota bacterium]